MLVGPLQVAAVVGLERRRHEQVVAGAVRPVGQRGRQAAAGAAVLAAAQVQLGQARLGLLGGVGRQLTEAGQPAQHAFRVGEAADFLVLAAQGQKVIDEIQRDRHGAASVQLRGCAPHMRP